MKTNQNPLLMIDIYKLGHMLFYKKGTTKIYSGMVARSTKKTPYAVFYGLQPYLYILSQSISQENANEFFAYYEETLGYAPSAKVLDYINGLVGRPLPLEIKAVAEGTVIDNKNVLVTVTSTDEKYFWLGGFFESLLLKVWNTTSVATLSHKYYKLAEDYTKRTSDSGFLLPFLVHDFGYRGVSSEMSAELSGSAHLVNFAGTDTLTAIKFAKNNYKATGLIGASVAASEHSIHQSFGPSEQDELDYVNNMMDEVPSGIVSVVSDAYDYWRMLTVTLPKVKERILARPEGSKYVVRPDSGDPKKILCGNCRHVINLDGAFSNFVSVNSSIEGGKKEVVEFGGKFYEFNTDAEAPVEVTPSPENLGTFRLLEELFGVTVNSKGFKELNAKVGVIYGDAMHYDRYADVLATMEEMGFANTNLVIGVGGLLLQQHNRDDLGFAFKATYAIINGEEKELYKDPITDPGKKSHKGLMVLDKDSNGKYHTIDQVTRQMETYGELKTVFKDGVVLKEHTFDEIRARAKA